MSYLRPDFRMAGILQFLQSTSYKQFCWDGKETFVVDDNDKTLNISDFEEQSDAFRLLEEIEDYCEYNNFGRFSVSLF